MSQPRRTIYCVTHRGMQVRVWFEPTLGAARRRQREVREWLADEREWLADERGEPGEIVIEPRVVNLSARGIATALNDLIEELCWNE